MKRVFLFFALILSVTLSFSQEKNDLKAYCIGFYNLENLFDTIVDLDTNKILQDEFTPKGKNAWTGEHYWEKIGNMAKVISEIGTDITPDGLAVLGVSEIENILVLQDLVNDPAIRDRNYKIVHYESPDRRGIDVGLIYQEKYFELTNTASIKLDMPVDSTYRTRDQLVVSGIMDGEEINFIVTHWPSKRGGEKRSRPNRIAAAKLGKHIIDSLFIKNPDTKTIYMGDLNDDPFSISVKEHLMTVGEQSEVKKGLLYNPMEKFQRKGIGTSAYRDVWSVIDQLVVSHTLIGEDKSSLKFHKAHIFKEPYLIQKSGRFANYPYRTYSYGVYKGGYSDHFAVYLFLTKNK